MRDCDKQNIGQGHVIFILRSRYIFIGHDALHKGKRKGCLSLVNRANSNCCTGLNGIIREDNICSAVMTEKPFSLEKC